VNLTNADLSNAMLRGASFRESNMQGVNLNNADLSHADLSFVNLTNADLRNVDMRHATIVRAKMKGIKIENPELHDLNLDSDSYEYIPNEIRVRFEKTWKYLNFKEIAKRDYAEIIIKLIPEYRSTGLTLLNYFPTLLEKKYPDQKVKVSFDYKGLDVFMMIDIVQGSREILLKAMKEYGSLLTGSLPVNEYTEDKILIMEIENELKCAQFRIDAEKEIA
ncbi:MAG: pentapeptide repeat-containing protein, partial [bacterium]|nr:pentapeptide repeat-containing protein [bacterium]